ncbi:uncharacterized protein ARMOST_14543 [Armillaria ostoyae]|uniref:Uncharacterized protein n=1 Tax=Armillaria ostoyae TaxID=47428 RepID=A0A284RQW8_ARMOS|nr:uncharacterized protein ARMOST_14543 [Armillaria ostoyae]
MSTASPHPDRKPRHASTMDIDQAESGSSRLLLEKSLSDDPTVDGGFFYRALALNDITIGTCWVHQYRMLHREQSVEYFVVKELASAYGKLLDVYEHVRHDMLGLIPWYTHPKLLRILLTLAKRLSPTILQEIHDSHLDTVHFTVDIRKQCKTLMEKRYMLFNPEKVYRIVEPPNMYSMALYFASGILIPLALLFDTSGKYAMTAVLLMLYCAGLGFAINSTRTAMLKVYDAINNVYKYSYLSTWAYLDLAAFLSRLGSSEGPLPGMSRAAMSLESFQARFLGGRDVLFKVHLQIESPVPEYNELEDEYWLEERLWAATQYNSTSATGGPDTSLLVAAANSSHAIPQSTTATLTSEVSDFTSGSPTTSSISQTGGGIHVQPATSYFRRRRSPVRSH